MKKENVIYLPTDHPELDDISFLNETEMTLYQSTIEKCQWISVTGRIDITFAVVSLNRCVAHRREGR